MRGYKVDIDSSFQGMMTYDPRSYKRNFCNCVWKPQKFFRLPYAISKIAFITSMIVAYLISHSQFNMPYFIYHFIFLRIVMKGLRSFRYKYIRYKLKLFRDIIEVDSIHVESRFDLTQSSGPQQGGGYRGSSSPPEIFRFELNSATKVEFCLLEWTAVNGSYSFQVLSIIGRLCTVVLLCNSELCKGRKSYFCSAKNDQQPSNICLFFIKIDRRKIDQNAPITIPELGLLDFFGF